MITEKDLFEQQERLKNEILSTFDGLDYDIGTYICKLVEKRMQILLDKLKEGE